MSNPLVLMYHAFGRRSDREDPHNLFVPAEAFDAQLTALLRRGYRPLDQAGFLAGLERKRWPARSFLVTVDDGYVSTLEVAAPILTRLGVPAVVFVLPGMLGATSRWMSRMPGEALLDGPGIRALQRQGIAIGLHGLDHASLVALPVTELHRQTVEARRSLADLIGHEPTLFAYPYGEHDAAARQAVAEAGFRAAFAIYSSGGPYALPRVDINSLDTLRTFRLKSSVLFPPTKAALDRTPAVRRTVHSLLGKAHR
jgi:peptidoglycan/xylan/chitin deacetylase (PgdA/CDA1 family)